MNCCPITQEYSRADDDSEIAREAATWVERRSNPIDAETANEFAAWIRASPKHARYYTAQAAVDAALREYVSGTAQASGDDTPEEPQSDTPAASTGRIGLRPMHAAAIGGLFIAALLVAALWKRQQSPSLSRYSVPAGASRQIVLEDGSIINLQQCSELRTRYSKDRREFLMTQCSALFKIRADPGRPFRVRFEGGTVEAMGTEFSILWKGAHSDVHVQDGDVRVHGLGANKKDIRLRTGQSAAVSLNGEIDEPIQIAKAPAESILPFDNAPLVDIAAAANRIHSVPRFEFKGEAANKRYNGTIDVADVERVIAAFQTYPDLLIERKGDVVTVRAKGE